MTSSRRARFASAVLLASMAACSSFNVATQNEAGVSGEGGHVPPFVFDASLHDAGIDAHVVSVSDAGHDATVDAAVTGIVDAGLDAEDVFEIPDVIDIGPPDVMVMLPDAAPDAPKLDACGICDRKWDCNGFTDTWESTGPEACADVRNGHVAVTLYCENGDTIDYPSATGNDGTWSQTSTGLAILFDSFGSTMEIDCVPGM